MLRLLIEQDTDRVDAGLIVREIAISRANVDTPVPGRYIFSNGTFTLIHQENSDGTDVNQVYHKGDFVYRDRRKGGATPVIDVYRTGLWERHIQSEFHLAVQTGLEL